MSDTKIEWCDRVWNPITGCTPVGEGCDNCYAEAMAKRRMWDYGFDVTFHPERLEQPIKRKKPTRYFVCSMGDMFHEGVAPRWRSDVFRVMADCPQHTFIVLTKRPKAMNSFAIFVSEYFGNGKPLTNVQLGVSVWDQESADEFIPILLDTPAGVRVVSIEPCLSSVDLERVWARMPSGGKSLWNVLTGEPKIDHVILGGETGPGARCIKTLGDVISVKDQCVATDTPFFFKGWGTAILPKKDPDYMLIDGERWEQLP